jgi:anti-sigma-K factor RskA
MADFMFDEAEENRSEFPETARQGPRPAMVSARRAADRPSLWTGAALAGAGAAAGAAMAVLILSSQVAFRSVPPGAPPAIAVAAVPPTPSPAAALHGADFMVAERSVRCNPGRRHRETGAPPGQEIRLLTGDGHWISLTRPGTRCWTLRAGARSVAVR